jgi:hypothetical protein
MGKKYISQVNNENFVFPNYKISEYDIDINHDLKENSVSGYTSGFTASFSGSSINVSFYYNWLLNGAEPYINTEGDLAILSVHMMTNTKKYHKPWICVYNLDSDTTTLTGSTGTASFTVTPQMVDQGSFSGGTYYFEVRFIGHRAVFPITQSLSIIPPTSTPTPTPTLTPTPTVTNTPTPTPTSFVPFSDITSDPKASAGEACSSIMFNPDPTVGNGTTFCNSTTLTNPSYGSLPTGTYYIHYNFQYVQVSLTNGDNTVAVTSACASCPTSTPTPTPTVTPTPTPVVYTFSLGYNASDSYAACLDYSSSPTNYYSYNPTFVNGTILYTNNGNPLTGNAPTGYYSDGSSVGYVPGDSGVVNGIAPCATNTPTPTPTPIYQGVAIYTGATFANSGLACANGSPPTSTLYVSITELPLGDGDRLYTNTSLTTNFVGNDQYYRIFINPSFYVATISAAGYISNFTNCSVVPTFTPTPTPTVTPTPTPTPFQTTFSGYVSLVDGPTACAGGEYATVNVTVQGTSLCNLTKVLGLSSTTYGNVYADMTNDDTFYVTDGTDWREFTRDGSAQTGTAQTACTSCSNPPTPTPIPTSTPTPAAYDVYERCDLTAIYYVDYSAGNLSNVTINGACCSRIAQNVDDAYILSNYPSAIYFGSFTNATCPCN